MNTLIIPFSYELLKVKKIIVMIDRSFENCVKGWKFHNFKDFFVKFEIL